MDSLATTKRSREVSDQLFQLSQSGSVLETRPSIDYDEWRRMASMGRPEFVPNLHAIAVTTDSHLKEVDPTLAHHGKLLVEPTLIPDLAHVGVKVNQT